MNGWVPSNLEILNSTLLKPEIKERKMSRRQNQRSGTASNGTAEVQGNTAVPEGRAEFVIENARTLSGRSSLFKHDVQ